jgi:hypothetical protein
MESENFAFFANEYQKCQIQTFCEVSQQSFCSPQGHFAKSQNLAFLVLICKKCKILRFHDLIAKIGIIKIRIAKIGILILAIHPDWDPDFSNPSRF